MQIGIHNAFLTVTADTSGAELMSILVADGTEYLWQGDPTYWKDRSLTLFPYVARLTEGRYRLDGNEYEMAIHGLAPYTEFRLAEQTRQSMTFEMTDTAETRKSYPRSFRFTVTYRLEGKTLVIAYGVENTDARALYFGLGGHPGFRVPLAQGKTFGDYRLRFGEVTPAKRIGFDAACFRTGHDEQFPLENGTVLKLGHGLFDDDAIVLRDMARTVTLETDGDPHTVTANFPQMPYLGLWHMPKTDAPYVCIEPWCSLPSSAGEETVFEEREDLIRVEPHGSYLNEWTLTFGM